MRCCVCPYRPQLSGYDIDECETDACSLVSDDETSEYLFHGKYEIGCKFNLPTLKKRKEKVDEYWNKGEICL